MLQKYILSNHKINEDAVVTVLSPSFFIEDPELLTVIIINQNNFLYPSILGF
jgi:hypothetical protein